jgi:hypothetical protein
MDDSPLADRLTKGFKDLIVRSIFYFIGLMIAFAVADLSPYGRWGVYWMMVSMGVLAVYWTAVWLLQLAWSRYPRSSNSN